MMLYSVQKTDTEVIYVFFTAARTSLQLFACHVDELSLIWYAQCFSCTATVAIKGFCQIRSSELLLYAKCFPRLDV